MSLSAPIRSALYLPADKDRALEKARTLPCDLVILDLEDAVAPDAKPVARQKAAAALRAGGFDSGTPMVRINGLDTPWGREDLFAAKDAGATRVLIPKVSSTHMLADARRLLGPGIALWAMVETCAGVLHIAQIANEGAGLGLEGFIIGPNDLAKEMRCKPGPERTPLLGALGLAIMAARANQLIILDGVYNDFRDPDGLRSECVQGVELGFDGKSLIHPDQIAITNELFSPSAEEIAQARAIADAFALPEHQGKGVINVNGKMVELLHLAEARRVLAIAERIG